jgi:hypothetical protein
MGNQHIYEHKFPAANETRQQVDRQAGKMPGSFSFGEGGQILIFYWILIDVSNW